MAFPEATHLQLYVLRILLDSEQSGRFVRERFAEEGQAKTGPAFYQLMARLEESGMVEGWYNQKIVAGQIIKERWYRVTGAGVRAWNEAADFYRAHEAAKANRRGGLARA
jgi:DNA-binding PadR family transcriptional regulator